MSLSTIVHELNQPLTAITMYVQGCVRKLEADNYQREELLHVMKQVLAQSTKMSEIIHTLVPTEGKEQR